MGLLRTAERDRARQHRGTRVKDCPTSGDKLPLVVVSHGRGGSLIGHHDTAETLADAGFIIAAIDHPGDTVSDLSRSGDLPVMVERPTDITADDLRSDAASADQL